MFKKTESQSFYKTAKFIFKILVIFFASCHLNNEKITYSNYPADYKKIYADSNFEILATQNPTIENYLIYVKNKDSIYYKVYEADRYEVFDYDNRFFVTSSVFGTYPIVWTFFSRSDTSKFYYENPLYLDLSKDLIITYEIKIKNDYQRIYLNFINIITKDTLKSYYLKECDEAYGFINEYIDSVYIKNDCLIIDWNKDTLPEYTIFIDSFPAERKILLPDL